MFPPRWRVMLRRVGRFAVHLVLINFLKCIYVVGIGCEVLQTETGGRRRGGSGLRRADLQGEGRR